MPHIMLPAEVPGIRGPMAFRPETAKPLNELVDVLLRGPNTLSPGERELIATFVSSQNDCRYCQTIHGAIAAHHLNGDEDLVVQVKTRSAARRHLGQAQGAARDRRQDRAKAASRSPRPTSSARAQHGATDLEIHDTVLIAAVFCMCNRYVDGLATWAPDDPAFYRQRAALVAEHGYAGVDADDHAPQDARHDSDSICRVLLAVCLLAAPAAFAQDTTGAIEGAVTDKTASAVAGAHVVARNLDTGFTKETDGRRRRLLPAAAAAGRPVQRHRRGAAVRDAGARADSGEREPDGARQRAAGAAVARPRP